MTRPDWDLWFMRMAYVVAQRGTCPRKQVGCVIVDDSDGSHAVLASGYNGSPRGMPDCTQVGCELEDINGRQSCVRTLHAESNALDRLSHRPGSLVLYTTAIPCHRCALRLRQNGRFVRVAYHEYYESQSTQKTLSVLAGSIELQRMDLPIEVVRGSYGDRVSQPEAYGASAFSPDQASAIRALIAEGGVGFALREIPRGDPGALAARNQVEISTGERQFADGDRPEWCAACKRHIRDHFGGVEYRCDPRQR